MFSQSARIRAIVPSKRPATDAVVIALTHLAPTAGDLAMARLFEQGFAWFSAANRQEVLQHVQAAVIAADHNLSRQLALHLGEAQTITLRDLADRVQALMVKTLGSHVIVADVCLMLPLLLMHG